MFVRIAQDIKNVEVKSSVLVRNVPKRNGRKEQSLAIIKLINGTKLKGKVTPKREISKQYMPKNKEKVLLKYHFSGDDEIHISDGYYDAYDFEFHIANNPKFRIVCVIAWKEIELPKEIKENDKVQS